MKLNDLKGVIAEDCICPVSDGEVVLFEKNTEVNMKIQILDFPVDGLALKLDGKKKPHSPLLREKNGHRKRVCDYVLFFCLGKKKCALFVELKQSLSRKSTAFHQLLCATPICAYLRSVAEVHFGDSWQGLQVYYALISQKIGRIDKRSVKISGRPETQVEKYESIKITVNCGRERISLRSLLKN